MADSSWAQINIGGDCPEALLSALAAEIYEESEFEIPDAKNDSLAYIESLINDETILFEKDCAKNGRFESLETWCRDHGLSYNRRRGPAEHQNADVTYYRVDTGKIINVYTGDHWGYGEDLCDAEPVLKAREALRQGFIPDALDLLDRAVGDLSKVTPLPPFRIVKNAKI